MACGPPTGGGPAAETAQGYLPPRPSSRSQPTSNHDTQQQQHHQRQHHHHHQGGSSQPAAQPASAHVLLPQPSPHHLSSQQLNPAAPSFVFGEGNQPESAAQFGSPLGGSQAGSRGQQAGQRVLAPHSTAGGSSSMHLGQRPSAAVATPVVLPTGAQGLPFLQARSPPWTATTS